MKSVDSPFQNHIRIINFFLYSIEYLVVVEVGQYSIGDFCLEITSKCSRSCAGYPCDLLVLVICW